MAANKNDILPKNFFKENMLTELSSAMLLRFKFTSMQGGGFDRIMDEAYEKLPFFDQQKETIAAEREKIQGTEDAAALVELARKGIELPNQGLIMEKLISRREETLPLLLKRYCTCMLEYYTETAAQVFAHCGKEAALKLREVYEEIRSPYARACACWVLGMTGAEEELPFLYQEYLRMKKEHPGEGFEQHPLMAIYLLCGEF